MKSNFLPRYSRILFTILFFLSLSMFYSTPLQAQSRTRLGLKASPIISWMNPDYTNWSSDGVRLGFGYGLMAEFGFGENYALTTGIEFASRGGKLHIQDTSNIIDQKIKLQYLDIPIGLKMKTNEIGYFTYFGQFGLISSVNLSAKEDSKSIITGNSAVTTKNKNISKSINPVSLALSIGIGAEYSFTEKTSFLVGLSFQKGLTDLLDDPTVFGTRLKYKSTLNSLALNLGILF